MYKLTSPTSPTSITRIADGACIPADPTNTDYATYLAWLAAGNTPLPADMPPWPPIKAAELDVVRTTFEQIINRLDGIAARFARAGDMPSALSCDATVVDLIAIPKSASVLAASNLLELKMAGAVSYNAAEAKLTPAALAAFRAMRA